MPRPRYIVLIALLWLAATAWVVQREIWPMLRAGQPPRFVIDLIDETTHGNNAEIVWLGVKNDQVLYTIKTGHEYRKQDDTFDLTGYVATKPKGPNQEDQIVHYQLDGKDTTAQELKLATSQFVTREGEPRAAQAKIEYFMRLDMAGKLHAKVDLELKRTKVVDGRFIPQWFGTVILYRPDSGITQSVDLSGKDVVLPPCESQYNPLLPRNRLPDLYPCRQWRVQVVDPLKDALAASLASLVPGVGPERRFLHAMVREETSELEWKTKMVPCHVVEYRDGDELVGRTWARASDGLVLRHESEVEKDGAMGDLQRRPTTGPRDHWDIIRETN
jgi:hypothetical protein